MRNPRKGEGRPRKKECECGRSIEKEWVVVGSERICLKCKELDELRAYETSKENLDLMNK